MKTLKENSKDSNMTAQEFTRLANNFYNSKNIAVDYERITLDSHLINYINGNKATVKKNYKVAFCWICLNEPYWQYAKNMIEGAKRFFLPGHQVDYFLWSDMPQQDFGAIIFETEPIEWPMPTLLRYHLFLQQEEILKEYDYIFYCDVDMQFVGIVGDEILSEGLTAAPHPGYFIRKELWPPYEPNKESASYINRPGVVALIENKPRFMPFYAAGGLQGGKATDFIKAMKECKKLIDNDQLKGYVPIWNDETAWNKYLFEVLPKDELNKVKFLTPSYIYPDSLIKEYYEPIVWGCSYPPKLITLTKKFTVSKEGGDAVARMIQK